MQLPSLEGLKSRAKRLVPQCAKERYHRRRVMHRVPYDNAYHCCTQRTASRMLKEIFSDPLFYYNSGLRPWVFTQDPGRVQDARITEPLPPNTIGTNLYIDYATFTRMPKPDAYKAFFILRDPRDIVTSWYFSVKYSHQPTGLVPRFRKDLSGLSLRDGLKYSIDTLWERGLFRAQLSWVGATGARVMIFRYEDLARDRIGFLLGLLGFLGVPMGDYDFEILARTHSFEAKSGGRSVGQVDIKSHYRAGTAGDWRDYFDRKVTAHFRKTTGNLVERLGYSPAPTAGTGTSRTMDGTKEDPISSTTQDHGACR
jgi:hypothetical protein